MAAKSAAAARSTLLPLAGGTFCLLLVLALFFWLNAHADDTRSRRALAVPSVSLPLDFTKSVSSEEYQRLLEKLTEAESAPPAPALLPEAKAPTLEAKAPAPLEALPQSAPLEALPAPEAVAPLTGKAPVEAAPAAPPPAQATAVSSPVQAAAPPPAVAAPAPAALETPGVPARPKAHLIENAPQGPIPRVSEKGERAWRSYVHPVPAGLKPPMVAIIVQNLGLSDKAVQDVFSRLPRQVTLAFNPYGREVDRLMGLARTAGFETLIGVPMQPTRFPQQDPGPRALMTDFTPEQNLEALKWSLGRGGSYIGVISIMGDAFTETAWRIEPIQKYLGSRGLLFVDNSTLRGGTVTSAVATRFTLPYARVDAVLDKSLAQGDIEAAFSSLEKIAKDNGIAVGVIGPYPASLSLLERWAAAAPKRGIQVVPLSAVARYRLEGAPQ